MRFITFFITGALLAQTPVLVRQNGNTATVTTGGALTVDASASTQPISGTVAATQSGGWAVTQSGTWNVGLTAGTNLFGKVTISQGGNDNTVSAAGALKVDGSAVTQPVSGTFFQATQPVSGTVTANAGTGTFAVSAASLPLPSGAATAAKQPALGTAGSPSADVITVQGAASMTKLLVTPDSVALPANQSVNVSQINGVTPLMGNGTTGTGSQRVTIASDNTPFSVNSAATLAAETTKVIGTVRNLGNSGAIMDAATGAAPPANAPLMAGLGSGATGGLLTGITVCDTFVNVNITTGTTTLLQAGTSGRHIRICSINLVTNAANNVGLISGTGSTCGTGTAAIVGTTAATGWNFAANGGITQGSGIGVIMRTVATGDSICAVTSATTQLSGSISLAIN